MSTHAGSCLCGQVRYEMEGDFERFYLCHCQYCRKDTGSAHAANLFAPAARLTWQSGADQVRTFNLPATRHSRCFCGNCGSALPYAIHGSGTDDPHGGLVVVPAGSLDSEVSLRPNAHIFTASKAGWDENLEQVPRVPQFPT